MYVCIDVRCMCVYRCEVCECVHRCEVWSVKMGMYIQGLGCVYVGVE